MSDNYLGACKVQNRTATVPTGSAAATLNRDMMNENISVLEW